MAPELKALDRAEAKAWNVSLNGALNSYHLDNWSDEAFREHIPAVRQTVQALERMTARSLHFEQECEALKLKLAAALSEADALRAA